MTESPRKRILSQISSEKSSKKEIDLSKISNNRFQRLGEVFKFSPTHSREISIPEANYDSERSKFNNKMDCLDQLNSIFKLRKVNDEKPFFEDGPKGKQVARSKSKINKDIEHSIVYIQNLKNRRNFTESTHDAGQSIFNRKQNQKQSIIEAIGLQLPELKPKKDDHSRFVTEPSLVHSRHREKKKAEQIGLYSYLERDFIDKKIQKLTDTKVIDYAKNPNNRNFHKMMLQKSRKFLKNAVENNFREVNKINSVINEESKKIIELEISEKKRKYERDYFTKINVPYFSFLTLKEKERESVLRAMNRKKSIS